MSTRTDAGSDTLLAPKTEQAPVAAPPAGPTPPRMRWYWPAIAATVAALAVLGVWTLTQLRTVDAPVDTPAITDHDPWVQQQLRQRNRALETQLDPWAHARQRERNQALESQLDPWAHARQRERNRALESQLDSWDRLRDRSQGYETQLDPWARARLREQQAARP
jgi:hypothetical protein